MPSDMSLTVRQHNGPLSRKLEMDQQMQVAGERKIEYLGAPGRGDQ
jgi:hypothetical protein